MSAPARRAPSTFTQVSNAATSLIDQLGDIDAFWAVREAVVDLAWSLDEDQRLKLAILLDEIGESLIRARRREG